MPGCAGGLPESHCLRCPVTKPYCEKFTKEFWTSFAGAVEAECWWVPVWERVFVELEPPPFYRDLIEDEF